MTVGYQRTLPLLTDLNRPFWTGGVNGELLILRCSACGFWQHPPQPRCWRCLSDDVAPEAVSGQGTIESFTLNMKSWGDGLEIPYAIAVVGLDEQASLRLTTNIVGSDPYTVAIDMRVRVVFERDEDVWLPFFTPIDTTPPGADRTAP